MGKILESVFGLNAGRMGAVKVSAGPSRACATESKAWAGCASGTRCAVLTGRDVWEPTHVAGGAGGAGAPRAR